MKIDLRVVHILSHGAALCGVERPYMTVRGPDWLDDFGTSNCYLCKLEANVRMREALL